jgi:benzoyl-CoA reductase/2-hydroxyglutaryl-CoA dehydratase subunit BcrC/BadD/HgdB
MNVNQISETVKFFVKRSNRKLRTKQFKDGFNDYNKARAAVKRDIRASGGNADFGFQYYGYNIIKT